MIISRFSAVVALLIAYGSVFAEEQSAKHLLVPISQLVTAENERAAKALGRSEDSVTEAEVVQSIAKQLPNLECDTGVKSLLAYIAQTKRVPVDTKLEIMQGGSIALDLRLTENSGYRLFVRHRALETQEDGTLKLKAGRVPSPSASENGSRSPGVVDYKP